MHYLKAALLVLAVCSIAGCSNLQGGKLLISDHLGMRDIGGDIYVESGADESRKADLLKARAKAETILHDAYGGVESHPKVHACISEKCFSSFGGRGAKAKIYADHILLSPRGLNYHFLAHEWSHDELHTRLDFWDWFRLPRWFDEGLAVVVSEDPRYSEDEWRFLVESGALQPTREELLACTTLRKWLDGVHRFGEGREAGAGTVEKPAGSPLYTAAGHEVRLWLSRVGRKGLLELIERLNAGETFEAVYSTAERDGSAEQIPDGISARAAGSDG